ncbi:MAG: hypothetical protein LBT48_06655 [Prevotellaceae bacterium]|jgi:hypothetical protein|nr:hypothetical protein [Prevotellaceae bacterium]
MTHILIKSNGGGGAAYVLSALAAALLCACFIFLYGVNVLHLDEWELVPLVQKMQDGTLSFADLWAQHNEHRIALPALLYLGLAAATGFNTVAPMWCSFALLSAAAYVVVRYAVRRRGVSGGRKILAAILLPFLLFSLAQYENLLWGFQITFIMALCLSIAAFYFLHLMIHAEDAKRRLRYFIAALAAAFAASFSSSQGLVLWITGAALLALAYRKKSASSPYFIGWNAAAVCAWAGYFYHYAKPERHPSLGYLFDHPAAFLKYFFSAAGNAFAGSFKAWAVPAGVVLVLFALAACLIVLRRKQTAHFFFPMALTLNSLLVLGSIAVGRVGLLEAMPEQALASRYTSFALCAAVGLALLWMELADAGGKKTAVKNAAYAFFILFFLSIPLSAAEGFHHGKEIEKLRDYNAYVLENKDFQPDYFLTYMYPSADSVRARAPFLEARRLNVFRKPRYAVPPALYADSLGRRAAAVLQIPAKALQVAPDFIVLARPAVHVRYKHSVQALFADFDGQIFPLHYRTTHNTRAANPSSMYGVSAVSKHVFAPGIHTLTYKALMNDGSYCIVPSGMAFER